LRRLSCPSCGSDISEQFNPRRDAYCPACGVGLAISFGPFRFLGLFAIVILGLVLFAAGLRGDQLLACVLLGSLPLRILMTRITAALFPVELVATGDVRGILHPLDPSRHDTVQAEPLNPQETSRFLTVLNPPQGLEGWTIRVAFFGLLLFGAWQAVSPIVYDTFPSLTPTLHGPAGFPISAHVLGNAISFTNDSWVDWNCTARLWFNGPTATFPIAANTSATISLSTFRDPDPSRPDDWPGAITSINMQCLEPSGTMHDGVVD
jgi:hypothetical protein